MKKITEIALFTGKVEILASFYERLLGTPPVQRGQGIAIFEVGGVQLLIHEKAPHEMGQPANEDHFALGVEDLDAASLELKDKHISLELEPVEYDWGRSAYLRDPDGRMIELHQENP